MTYDVARETAPTSTAYTARHNAPAPPIHSNEQECGRRVRYDHTARYDAPLPLPASNAFKCAE